MISKLQKGQRLLQKIVIRDVLVLKGHLDTGCAACMLTWIVDRVFLAAKTDLAELVIVNHLIILGIAGISLYFLLAYQIVNITKHLAKPFHHGDFFIIFWRQIVDYALKQAVEKRNFKAIISIDQ